MAIITIQDFLEKKKIKFETEQAKISWFKRLKPDSLIRIGSVYFVDEMEAENLFKKAVNKKVATRRKRQDFIKRNRAKLRAARAAKQQQQNNQLFDDD